MPGRGGRPSGPGGGSGRSGGARRLKDKRLQELKQRVGIWWKIAAAMGFLSGFLMILSAGTSWWLIVPKHKVRYTSVVALGVQKNRAEIEYSNNEFGLYLTSINGNTQPWFAKQAIVCSGYDILHEQAAQSTVIEIWGSACGSNCVSHFRSRCSVYKNLSRLGYIGLAVLVGAGCCSLLGSAWLVVFGKSRQFLQLIWLCCGVIVSGFVGIYAYLQWQYLDILNQTSFYRRWYLGASFWLATTSAILAISAASLIIVASSSDARQERNIRADLLAKKEAAKEDLELPQEMRDLDVFGLGPQPGMHMGGGSPFQQGVDVPRSGRQTPRR